MARLTMRSLQKLAELGSGSDKMVGGAAGIGAAVLVNNLMKNQIQVKEQVFREALRDYARVKSGPIIAGAVTALLVSSMVASKTKEKERMRQLAANKSLFQQHQQQQQGYYPGEQVNFPEGQSAYR